MLAHELRKYANAFLNENYGMRLTVPIEVSARLKSTFGQFVFMRGGGVPVRIKMSKQFMDTHTKAETLDVLYHECVHYALYVKGKPFSDGDAHFKNEVDRLGVSRTRTYKSKGLKHCYRCNDCGRQSVRNMKGYEKRYVCGRCHGRFSYTGEIEI